MFRYRLLIINSILLLALLGAYWGRRVEDAVPSRTDFLRPLDLPFRGWKTTDAVLTPSDLNLLKPDAVLVRRYQGPDGQSAELAVIAGHRKQSVHTPGFCMVGGGWEALVQGECDLVLGDRRIPAVRSVMAVGARQVVATYFFTDGDYCTRSLVQFQGVQLLKRFRQEIPVGALVRILVPIRTDRAEAERLADDFARATVPKVLASLRLTHLQTH